LPLPVRKPQDRRSSCRHFHSSRSARRSRSPTAAVLIKGVLAALATGKTLWGFRARQRQEQSHTDCKPGSRASRRRSSITRSSIQRRHKPAWAPFRPQPRPKRGVSPKLDGVRPATCPAVWRMPTACGPPRRSLGKKRQSNFLNKAAPPKRQAKRPSRGSIIRTRPNAPKARCAMKRCQAGGGCRRQRLPANRPEIEKHRGREPQITRMSRIGFPRRSLGTYLCNPCYPWFIISVVPRVLLCA